MKCRFFLTAVCLMSCATTVLAAQPALVIDSGGNTRYVRKVIFTKDGTQLVSVGDERVIRVWSVKSGRTERTIRDQIGPCADCQIGDIALSPDNTYLAVGGTFPGTTPEERFAIHIYNFETGERLQQLKGHLVRVSALAFSADGQHLASGSDYFSKADRKGAEVPVRVWSLNTQGWQPALKLGGAHDETVSSLAFSADGQWLASGSTNGGLFLWRLTSPLTPIGKPLVQHYDAIFGLAFLPDGRLISAGLDRHIYIWDAKGDSSKQLGEELPSGIRSMDLSQDTDHPRLVVGLEDGSSRVVPLSDPNRITTFKRDRDQVRAVAFSAADKNLIASSGGFNGEIWVWNADTGQTVLGGFFAGRGRSVWSVGFSQDGTSLAFGTERSSDAPNHYGSLQQVIGFKSAYRASNSQTTAQGTYQISLGGKVIGDYYSAIPKVGEYELRTQYGAILKKRIAPGVLVDDPKRLTDLLILRNGQQVNSIKRDSQSGRSHLCYTFTKDGRYIISGGEGGYLALYDTKTGKLNHEFQGHTNDVWSVAVHPDGRFVISGSSDQTIKVWDIKSDTYVLSIFVGADREWIAWTPQGYYTSSFRGDRYIGWQVETENNLRPDFYRAEQFSKLFYRPDVISEFLATLDIQTAVEKAGLQKSGVDFLSNIVAATTAIKASTVADNVPPQIEILAPADDSTVADRLLKVKIKVTSTNLPITNVQVSLNGFQEGTFKGVPDDKERARKVEIEMTVALKPGQNTLVVNASHEVAKSQPQTRKIYFKPPGEKPEEPDLVRPFGAYFHRIKYSTAGFVAARVSSTALTPAPPTIRILEPEQSPNPIPISSERLFLRVLVPSGTEGREVKVKILVNGTELRKQDITPGLELPFNIDLGDDGDYTVTAISIVDGVESAPETRRIRYVNPKPQKPNLFFLGIGIKGYKRLEPGLKYADKDAEALAKLLTNLQNSPLFNKVETSVLSNEQATRINILKGLDWLNKSAVHENDVRVVLFSGHGGIFEPVNQYYFYVQDQVPNEDPEILSPNWNTIVQRLSKHPIRSPVLLFVDTCRAAAAIPKEVTDEASGLVFFGASGRNEKANEDDEWGHGAFTKAVLEGLSGCADASTAGRLADGMIDFVELGGFIQKRVRELNDSQTAAFVPVNGLPVFSISLTPPNPPECPRPRNQ